MKNKGFTLIELLAVIVILAIIALIASPTILNIIETTKKKAAVTSANGYAEALETQNAMAQLDEENYKEYSDGEYDVSQITLNNIKGTKPTSGNVVLKNGSVAVGTYLCIDNYKVVYSDKGFDATDEKCEATSKNYESIIMLDVARRYYTVDEIKKYIDVLSVNKNSTLQLHFTDNENVGIESKYLDQTVANATNVNGVYTNPNVGENGRKFLSFEQVKEIITYAKSKNVRFVPEIDVPAHMNGFFDLAVKKFGLEYVTRISPTYGTDSDIGNLDIGYELENEEAKDFVTQIYNEYTTFFKEQGCEYFHIGFDEYTRRIDEKPAYMNTLYKDLNEKGFKVRMWSDGITKTNASSINKNIEIMYWSYRSGDEYATVPDLQKLGFKIVNANSYYLFFVPSSTSTTEESFNKSVNDIKNIWSLEEWKYNYDTTLESKENMLGAMITVWGEDSEGISNDVILKQTKAMYDAMYSKLK
ncbi:MAG: prepilin-type N-terminal cleavage/methylation domain-containing protein [Lactobacillales bacterium]|nr:prepilin-type N-terminal cleavage/methylation domain-containing protein [Lactobacillales bacterium]